MLGLAIVAMATPAAATRVGTIGIGPVPGLEILCEGDCSALPTSPRNRDGTPFDFVYGIRPLTDGFDLTLSSDANVFLLAPLRTTESMQFFGRVSIDAIGNNTLEAGGNIVLEVGLIPSKFPLGIAPPIIPGTRPFNPICGCISISAGGIEIATSPGIEISGPRIELGPGGRIRLVDSGVEAVTRVVQEQTISGLTISRSGDLYVDLSRVTLRNLRVKAGKTIVIMASDSVPVPEPGTALLLGIGLALLASSQRSRLVH